MGGISVLGDSCERGFVLFEGGEGIYLELFSKIYIYLTQMLDHAVHFCLYNHAIVAQYYTQHKPDFVSCI